MLYITTKKKKVGKFELSLDSDESLEDTFRQDAGMPKSMEPQDSFALEKRRNLIAEQRKPIMTCSVLTSPKMSVNNHGLLL